MFLSVLLSFDQTFVQCVLERRSGLSVPNLWVLESSVLLLMVWECVSDFGHDTRRKGHPVVPSKPSPCPEHKVSIGSVPVTTGIEEKYERLCYETVSETNQNYFLA